jgi:GAF domain-containing protein
MNDEELWRPLDDSDSSPKTAGAPLGAEGQRPSPPAPSAGPPRLDLSALEGQDAREGEKEKAVVMPEPAPAEETWVWRQQLLRAVLRVLVFIGAPALVAAAYGLYRTGDLWLLPYYVVGYAVLVLITLWKRVPHVVQVGGLLCLVYAWGILELVDSGLVGEGRTVLLILPFAAMILVGPRGAVGSLALAALTLAGFAWAYSAGGLVLSPEIQAGLTDPIWWLNSVLVFVMLGVFLVVSQNHIIPRLTAALSRSRGLAQELETHRTRLEEQVAERTRALQEANYVLQRRAVQLEASAAVGRAVTSIFDIDRLLRTTVDLICDRFGFYHAGVFLLDETGEWAVLREAAGRAGAEMKTQGHRLSVAETSMVGWTALHRQPRIALDVGKDRIHFVHPLLAETRSEVTLPLVVGAKLLGVLDVQSTEEAAFDRDDVRVLQNMAGQIAIAIENARRVSKEATLLEATSPVFRAGRRLTTATTVEEVAEAIIAAVADTDAESCLVGLFEPPGSDEPAGLHVIGTWQRDRAFPFELGTHIPVSASPLPVDALRSLYVVEDITQPSAFLKANRAFFGQAGVRAAINVPLRIGGRSVGFVTVYRNTPGPFSESALRLYETLSDQAALALERAQLLRETQERVERERLTRQAADRIRRAADIEQALRTTAVVVSEVLAVPHVSIELSVEASEQD